MLSDVVTIDREQALSYRSFSVSVMEIMHFCRNSFIQNPAAQLVLTNVLLIDLSLPDAAAITVEAGWGVFN